MAFLQGDPRARGKLIQSLGDIVRSQAGPGVVADSADAFFQQRGLTGDALTEALGTPEEFLERYRSWQGKYNKAFETKLDLTKTNRIVAGVKAKRGFSDLNILDRQSAQMLHDDFLRDVMRIDTLMFKHGAPGMQLPTGNVYRSAFMFDMDNGSKMSHPAQAFLNGQIFNFNEQKSGLQSISIGKNIKSFDLFSQEWDRIGRQGANEFTTQIAPFGDISLQGKVVRTLDIESTGLHRGSEARSISVAEMVLDESGNFKVDSVGRAMGPKTIFNVGFESSQLNGLFVSDMNYGSSTMNDFIMRNEGFGKANFHTGDQFLDKTSDVLERLLEADVVAGHNIAYDIDMIADTMMAHPEFAKHERAGSLLDQFYNKIKEGNFVVDTANSARAYMQREGQIAVDAFEAEYNDARRATGEVLAAQQKHQAKLELMLAPENLAKGSLLERSGRASYTYASVGNIVMNTNLAELIEKDSPEAAQQLFEMIQQGSHIAETDVHLQSYIGKYMQDSKLKLRSNYLRGGGVLSEFGNFVRSQVAKSSAITSVTNIASVKQLSDTVFDYVSSSGLTGVQIKASIGELVDKNLLDINDITSNIGEISTSARNMSAADVRAVEGTIAFSDGKFVFSSGVGHVRELDSQSAQSHIQSVLKRAREVQQEIVEDERKISQGLISEQSARHRQSTLVAGKSVYSSKNIYDDKIYDTGISYGTASSADQLGLLRNISISTTPEAESISKTLGSIYEDFGTGMTYRDQLRSVSGRGSTASGFGRGLANFGEQDVVNMAERYGTIGDVYAKLLDPRARAYNTVMANATAETARNAAEAAVRAGKPGVDVASRTASFANQGVLAELMGGVFEGQVKTRILDVSGMAAKSRPNVMIQPKLVEGIIGQLAEESGSVAQALASPKLLGSSTANLIDRNILNISWQIGEQHGREGARLFTNKLFEVMTDDTVEDGLTGYEKVSRLLKLNDGELPDDLKTEITKVNLLTSEQRTAAIEEVTESIHNRGVIYATGDDKVQAAVMQGLTDLNRYSENDEIQALRAIEQKHHLGEDKVVAGAWHDPKAIKANNLEGEMAAANEVVTLDDGSKISKSIAANNQIIQTIDSQEGGLEQLTNMVSRKKAGLGENKMLEFYMTHKTGFKAGAIGVAAAGLAYMVAKKHRESALYDETMAQQPVEKGRGVDTMNGSAKSFTQNTPRFSDPLATAGVVGGLDRMKTGHTRMGNNRNDHLFGG
jgi:hypothetical protein